MRCYEDRSWSKPKNGSISEARILRTRNGSLFLQAVRKKNGSYERRRNDRSGKLRSLKTWPGRKRRELRRQRNAGKSRSRPHKSSPKNRQDVPEKQSDTQKSRKIPPANYGSALG